MTGGGDGEDVEATPATGLGVPTPAISVKLEGYPWIQLFRGRVRVDELAGIRSRRECEEREVQRERVREGK